MDPIDPIDDTIQENITISIKDQVNEQSYVNLSELKKGWKIIYCYNCFRYI